MSLLKGAPAQPGREWVTICGVPVELDSWFVRKIVWMARADPALVQAQLYLRSRGEPSMPPGA